jgi:hypothetical protein
MAIGGVKPEHGRGVLFGPEHRRDELLSMLLANVGVHDVLELAPLELWQQALAGTHDGDA